MISLIPKVHKPNSVGQLISCSNIEDKCISELLCDRLALVLLEIVNPTHIVFIKGRSLLYNILVCHDLLRQYKRKTTSRCLVKIYLKKADDLVE